ncbi:MAG: hypothetical protein FH753_00845 [Firmicutes bacterium]|nr:hypothetical protein [Bacillota bacterium]
MLLKEALEEYMFDCQARGLSEETVKNYGFNIKIFLRYLLEKNVEKVEEIKKTHIKQFAIYQQKQKYETSYINTNLRSIKAFIKYLHEEEYIENIIEVKEIKKDKKVIETFTDQEIREILKLLHRPKKFIEIRDKAIIYTMIDCGLRASEIIKLRHKDIKDNNTLFIQGKGKKERFVSFSAITKKAYMKYERTKKSYFLDKPFISDRYFLSKDGTEITRYILQYLVKKHCKKANISRDKAFPHNFRHYFAVKSLREGLDLYSLSRIMGHSDINTTSKYTNSLRDQDIQELSLKSSPLMNLRGGDR